MPRAALASACAAFALAWPSSAKAELKLTEVGGWVVSTDGRVNAFISHVWGDNRPKGLENLNWVGFNESNSPGQPDADDKLRKTRIRSGYVPSTFAMNFRKKVNDDFKLTSRVEIGIQITTIDPAFIADPSFMEARSVYLDIAGRWGSVRAGRDLSLFPRSNLLMNYELGHGYGVGFPCAYERMFGGACGHVGFGTLWPDFRAQITYSTPNFGDVFQVSVGVFDPRTVPTFNWDKTPIPRVEGEAVAKYDFQEGFGVKAWGNGFWQQIGTTGDTNPDPAPEAVALENFTQNAYGVGGGIQGNLGPVKAGFSGYMGQGMDGFVTFTFNPVYMTITSDPAVPNYERKFRPTRGFLAEASVTFGNTWVMGGFGQAMFDRLDNDNPLNTLNAAPLLRTQTGISAGVFQRVDQVVFGLDYFNARYGFDPRFYDPNVSDMVAPTYVDSEQVVHTVNGGVTLEW